MNYGALPLTGVGVLVLGGVAIHFPWIAAAGAIFVIAGAFILWATNRRRSVARGLPR